MLQNEMTLLQLIRYFNGTASEKLIQQIENLKVNDPPFAEEIEEWEDFIQSFPSREEGIEKLLDLHQEWHEVVPDNLEQRLRRIERTGSKQRDMIPFTLIFLIFLVILSLCCFLWFCSFD